MQSYCTTDFPDQNIRALQSSHQRTTTALTGCTTICDNVWQILVNSAKDKPMAKAQVKQALEEAGLVDSFVDGAQAPEEEGGFMSGLKKDLGQNWCYYLCCRAELVLLSML